jgi:hypothetical protein
MNTNKDDKMVYIGLGSIVTTRPFSLFLKKNILIPNVAETNILISVEEKKLSDSEFLSYNLMLNSGKNNILTLVLSEKKFLNDTKNHWWMKPEYPEKTTDLPH